MEENSNLSKNQYWAPNLTKAIESYNIHDSVREQVIINDHLRTATLILVPRIYYRTVKASIRLIIVFQLSR